MDTSLEGSRSGRPACRSIAQAASSVVEGLEGRRMFATVSLALTDGTIAEAGVDPAVFTITRDTTVGDQVVKYRVGGSASQVQAASPVNLVDFGATATANTYGLPGWTTAFKDVYNTYTADGPDGLKGGINGTYNHQGVSGTAPRAFVAGDKIRVTWYNNSDTPRALNPRISFNDPDRPNMGVVGTWTYTGAITIPAFSSMDSELTVTAGLAGSYSLVNASPTYVTPSDWGSSIIADKITLLPATGVGDYAETLTGSVTIPAGSLSTTLTVTPVDDALNETHETLTIALAEPDGGYTLGAVNQATVRITENDVVQGVYREVGPGKTYATPSAAFAAANAGDIIDIYPDSDGVYTGNFSTISDSNLLVRGIGESRVKVHNLTSNLISNGKGIWVFNSGLSGLTVENMDFQGARVADKNAGGIRLQGEDWTLRNCYFGNNENGILSDSTSTTNNVLIEYSEFEGNGITTAGAPIGNTHNVYISTNCASLTFQYNYTRNSNDGHLLKTRADANYILYNRFNSDLHGSYEINVPIGGKTYIIGNVIRQSSSSSNGTIIDYGSEGSVQTTDYLYVLHNTIVNNRSAGTFISGKNLPVGFNVTVQNNILAGVGTQIFMNTGTPTTGGNYANTNIAAVGFVNTATHNYHLLSTSPALNVGVVLGTSVDAYALTPTKQYVHRSWFEDRAADATPDAGAYDFV